jgi:hypothetical protein
MRFGWAGHWQRPVGAMRQAGLKEVRFRFDFEGTKVILA